MENQVNPSQQVRINDTDVIKWLGQEIYQRNLLEKQLRDEIAKRDQVIKQLEEQKKQIEAELRQFKKSNEIKKG